MKNAESAGQQQVHEQADEVERRIQFAIARVGMRLILHEAGVGARMAPAAGRHQICFGDRRSRVGCRQHIMRSVAIPAARRLHIAAQRTQLRVGHFTDAPPARRPPPPVPCRLDSRPARRCLRAAVHGHPRRVLESRFHPTFLRNRCNRDRPDDLLYAIAPGILKSISVPVPIPLHMFRLAPIWQARSRIPLRP